MFGLLVSVPNFSWNDFNSRCPHVPILDNGGTGLIDLKNKKLKKEKSLKLQAVLTAYPRAARMKPELV